MDDIDVIRRAKKRDEVQSRTVPQFEYNTKSSYLACNYNLQRCASTEDGENVTEKKVVSTNTNKYRH